MQEVVAGITDLEAILGLPVCKAVPGITDLQVILRLPVCKVVPGITDLEAILRLPVCKAVSGKCFIVKCRRNQYRRNPRWKILYFDSAITIPEYGGIRLIFSFNFSFNIFNLLVASPLFGTYCCGIMEAERT